MESVELGLHELHREWTAEDITVLTADVALPRPEGESRGLRRLRRYYEHFARCYLRYCQRFLYPQALTAFQEALAASTPWKPHAAQLTAHVTRNGDGVLSLYTDDREDCGGRPLVIRRGDTWDLTTCLPLSPADFFPPRVRWKHQFLAFADETARRQLAEGVSLYREDWRRCLRRNFSREHFYLTDQGLCFFYQMYLLSPPVESVRVFCLPWGKEGPFPLPRRG